MTMLRPHGPRREDTARTQPGGATVADIRTMEGDQALAVIMLRDWFDGPQGQARVSQTFLQELGAQAGAGAIDAWADFGALISDGTRRDVMRHSVNCRCVGADEAVLAQVISLAARGAREDAMLILSLLVTGERLLPAIQTVEQVGAALLRISQSWRRAALRPTSAADARLH
ncbi:hypothetical protein JANAI62_20440 [Jannaschia pagri]|uniref:Uncharacterized protein n=1 Tax=Jannaschia pagri TaxID=2829797 RepID=A0ABQ4NLY4_9RHOB|nr:MULTISPECIES: hypothetical protein [unclassified Jannaschia]GIT91587.1 hypothetical protein JANAI61_20450 [Jannaschia sp. AI_61]GIT95421.1 hypothetical protein JANAI62_20440 [Jannaschia sp. AI_62]